MENLISRQKGNSLLTDICLTLLDPYFRNDYNIITDNFFASINVAEKLLVQRTTILGTTVGSA